MKRSSSHGGSRSRRSYPSLNQISLTPLTPRYPIDDDDDDGNGHSHDDDHSQGYYSARSTSPDHPYSAGASTPRTRTPPSHLSSLSVPGTPGLLSQSHSRSASRTRTRHGRTKSSSRTSAGLSSNDAGSERRTPGHHGRHQSSSSTGGSGSHRGQPDSEWMLRTGMALAESTREEKGQSWLVKRQSSTSLASDANNTSNNNNYESTGTTRASSRRRSSKSRPSSSGMSTPRRSSRRSSRPDLGMTVTGLEMTSHTRVATPPSASDDQSRGFRPDVVDARIRAEMALMGQQQRGGDRDIDEDDAWSEADDDDDDDDDGRSIDSADEIDEKEMQRLTRERGFGLGSWLDRMVEWTLFGVDEWPSVSASAEALPAAAVEDAVDTPHPPDQIKATTADRDDDGYNLAGNTGDNSSLSECDDKSSVILVETPGEKGGWEDARWLLHAIKRALFQ